MRRLGVLGVLGMLGAGLCGAGLLAGSGCASDPTRGYAFGATHDLAVGTVSVPIFRNDTYYDGLEVTLTEALITEIQSSTPWRVVEPAHAATTLTGAIEDVVLEKLTYQRDTGLVQEQALRITVGFDWVDNRTGRVRVSRRQFVAVSSFVPHRGAGEPIEIGQASVVAELARDIVAEMRSDW